MISRGEKVTWHRASTDETDSYGKPMTTWEDIVLEEVGVAPGSSSEPRHATNINRLSTSMTITLTEDPGIGPEDEFTVRGRRYEVEGDVGGAWVNPFTGTSFGTEVELRRVSG